MLGENSDPPPPTPRGAHEVGTGAAAARHTEINTVKIHNLPVDFAGKHDLLIKMQNVLYLELYHNSRELTGF
jgi:hypothetical protein